MPTPQQRPPNGILSRKERLKTWRKEKGISVDVPSDVILPRDIMETIAETGPGTEAELQSLMKECPARFRRFGSEILAVSLNGSGEDEENCTGSR